MRGKTGEIYRILLGYYGPQGWWPLYSRRGTAGYDSEGYAKGVSLKKNASGTLSLRDKFEISAGAVLTQNTSWNNVKLALSRLHGEDLLDPRKIERIPADDLAVLIKSSGYYNQKAVKLKILAEFFSEYCTEDSYIPDRSSLLGLWGIGKETADSILLYAFREPFFVVDAYTRRIFSRLGMIDGGEEYDDIAEMFTSELGRNSMLFGEYHALIVRHAKEHCRRKPVCAGCVLSEYCGNK